MTFSAWKRERFILCAIFVYVLSGSSVMAEASVQHVGIVRIPDGAIPSDYYSLQHGNQVISPAELRQNMPVSNGDIIQPRPGKVPVLHYVVRKCGSNEKITTKTKVQCAHPVSKSTWKHFVSFLVEIPGKFIKSNHNIPFVRLVTTMTTKGEKKDCFPEYFDMTPWPPNGSTFLADQGSKLFRQEILSSNCADGKLVIREENGGTPVIERSYVTGSLLELSPLPESDKQYKWDVEVSTEGKTQISDVHRFSVLSDEQSAVIWDDLHNLARFYQGSELILVQAGYLQYLSDMDENLNLVAESAQLLRKYMRINDGVNHCDFFSLWNRLSSSHNFEIKECRPVEHNK